LLRPSILTAVTTSLASDISDPLVLRSARCRETWRNYVVKPDTAGGTGRNVWFRLTRDTSAPAEGLRGSG
jgi:hypothetical protein